MSPMRILIIEDEVKIAESLKRGLAAEGYVVDVAYDSDQADVLVGSTDYDAVLVDWMIPGKYDGPELIRKWRADSVEFPVLLLTARGSIGDKVGGLDAGADDYLSKPFSFDELLARVRALLRRPKNHVGSLIESSGVTLDLVAKSVTVDGRELHITAKEFQLLEYLMRHSGEVLSKERLLSHVWTDEDRVQHNTVETFIAHLRKKLNKDVIQTVRGYGYIVK
jgi:DNA-binding response OmpR family regulator